MAAPQIKIIQNIDLFRAQLNTILREWFPRLIPGGGTTGQVLKKASNSDYDTAWGAAGGTGTVTSVAATSADLTITGSPITTSGTLDFTLKTVNSNVGTFGSATQVGVFTVNGKGLITAASNVTITAPTLQTARTFSYTGDVTGGPTSFDGSANVSTALTLASVVTAGTNTKITYNAKGLVTAGAAAVLASADFANQGTATTVLHGNAAGNPSFGAVALATDVSGTLPVANGGTGQTSYTDGQLLIGNSTGNTLTKATLSSSDGSVTITNGGGSINLSVSTLVAKPNKLINSAMGIDQANEGVSVSIATTTQSYITDQWIAAFTGAATGVSATRIADAPGGFTHSLKVTVTTGSATLNAGDFLIILQNIEGTEVVEAQLGLSGAQKLSLSFWVKASITGTFGYSLRNSARNRSYVDVFTIAAANTWQQVTVDGITGDTTGTWLVSQATIGLTLTIALMSGSTFKGTSGSWQGSNLLTTTAQTNLAATSGATFQLTAVKVEVSPVHTQFELEAISEELIKCQRYFEKTYDPDTAIGTLNAFNSEIAGYNGLAVTNGSTIAIGWQYKVTKCKLPTVTFYRPRGTNAANTVDNNASSLAVTSFVGMNAAYPNNNSGGTLAALHLIEFQGVADARI